MFQKLRGTIEPLLVDRTARRLLITSAFFNAVTWILLLVRLIPAVRRGTAVALHYNVSLNVTSVGSAYLTLFPAVLGTVLLALNLVLAARCYRPSRPNALVFLSVTVFYELMLLAASIFIAIVNLTR
jgi:hypothetical protein